jgi:hypothetical protein
MNSEDLQGMKRETSYKYERIVPHRYHSLDPERVGIFCHDRRAHLSPHETVDEASLSNINLFYYAIVVPPVSLDLSSAFPGYCGRNTGDVTL